MSHKKIRELDPLNIDSRIKDLPTYNQAGDVGAIWDLTEAATSQLNVNSLNREMATASMRDLDFLISSGIRHGADFVRDNVELEQILLNLGEIACMIPRGTVSTYALANPRGERQRSFTGSPEEALFIESVRSGAESVEQSLVIYVAEGQLSGLNAMSESVSDMLRSILEVRKGVSPVYFTGQLRPYFEPIMIGGESYAGSGGAQLQFIAIDYLLWGADSQNQIYKDYFEDNVRYLSPEQRTLLEKGIEMNNGHSLLHSARETKDIEIATAATEVLQGLKKFRYPHRKIARDNFAIRPDGSVGSGVYTPDILDILLDETILTIDGFGEITQND